MRISTLFQLGRAGLYARSTEIAGKKNREKKTVTVHERIDASDIWQREFGSVAVLDLIARGIHAEGEFLRSSMFSTEGEFLRSSMFSTITVI